MIFPHEMRRLLLAYAVFSPWLLFAPPKAAAPAAPAAEAAEPAALPVAKSEAKASPSPVSASMRDEKYVIKPGDRINYRVPEDRDDPVVLLISSGGEINVPYYGRVNVGGKTLGEASRMIKEALEKDLYNKATVTMAVDAGYAPNKASRITVVGAVKSQGPQEIPVGERYTASQAILKAGGFTSFANQRKVHVFRKKSDRKTDQKVEELVVDVKAVLTDGELDKDVELLPDDHIVVRENLFNTGF